MIWDLINPSDGVLFDAPDREIAAIATWLLSPAYGASAVSEDGVEDVPIAMFGYPPDFDDDRIRRVFTERKPEVADALASFRYASKQTSLNPIIDEAHKLAKHLQ